MSAHRNIFPVVNHNGDFEGIIHVEDIREIMFQKERCRV